MSCFMGIDLGTSSVKVLLADERGNIKGISQRNYDIRKRRSEYAEQDMEVLWEACRDAIRETVDADPQRGADIAGIGFSGQMHGLVLVDKDGVPLRDAIIWADQRSAEEIREVYARIPEESYRSVSLNSLSTGFLAASLLWVRKNEPKLYEKAYKVMLPKDYIRYKLCGTFATDASDASGTGLFDVSKRQWAWEMMNRLEIGRELFPECHEAAEQAGATSRSCEAQTGLKAGIPVVFGGGDTPMQALGNGITGPGTLAANIGTACQIAAVEGSPVHDANYRTNTFCHVCGQQWMVMGAHLSGGVALKWLRDQILRMKSYDVMTALAGTAPAGSEGLLFLPYLNGERTPYHDPNARGIYLGLTLKHSRAHMIRSAMEGIVYGLRNSLEIFQDMGILSDRVIASGGGARGRLFLEIQADVFGKDIYTNLCGEQAGMGAAITAAVGVKAFDSFAEACREMVHMSPEPVRPNAERRKVYEEQYARYRELYPRNKDLF